MSPSLTLEELAAWQAQEAARAAERAKLDELAADVLDHLRATRTALERTPAALDLAAASFERALAADVLLEAAESEAGSR